MSFSVHFDQANFNREVQKFLRAIPEKVRERAVRKIAFDVVSDVVVGIGGFFGNPKRIDTGRYRAGWGVAARIGELPGAGRLPRAPGSEPGDGSARWSESLTRTGITVANNVEYGPHVEHGTARMAPGKHLATALQRGGSDLRTIRKEIEAGL